MPRERVPRRLTERDINSIMRHAQRELSKNGRTSVRDSEEAPAHGIRKSDLDDIMKYAKKHLSDVGCTSVRGLEDGPSFH